jgi:hypothetical protein
MRSRLPSGHLRPWSGSLLFRCSAALLIWIICAGGVRGQVSPQEILDPELRQLEATYLLQLKTLHHGISATKFPFPFTLARYVAAKPGSSASGDSRGVEFVHFHGRVVLKITGNYNAALSSALLTANERAARVFTDVYIPILLLVRQDIPEDAECQAIGFEVSYHVLGKSKTYEYEGREILVAVFDRADAFALAATDSDAQRQEILNRSEVFLNGEEFGLALGARDPIVLESLGRTSASQLDRRTQAKSASPPPGVTSATAVSPRPLPPLSVPALPAGVPPAGTTSSGETAAASRSEQLPGPPPATRAEAERLQAKYQTQLDALAKEGVLRFHFVDYAPPSFVLFQDHIALQLTLRNPARFDREHTSIYKRAAQSFDLFLAPQLKDVLSRISSEVEFPRLDITILIQFQSPSTGSPEAIEFISPLKAMREFADARITNQDLIDQSIVLVNGVRVALNLQSVE